jgi:hypothetical protein
MSLSLYIALSIRQGNTVVRALRIGVSACTQANIIEPAYHQVSQTS